MPQQQQQQYQQQHHQQQQNFAYQQQQQQQQQQQAQQQQTPQWAQNTSPTASQSRPRPAAKQTQSLDVARAQAVFDPLIEKAQSYHGEAAGKEGITKGLRELYSKLQDKDFPAGVENDLAQLVGAMETRDLNTATQLRDKLVRTTTTGWVQGGTWQWALKQLMMAARG